MTIPSREEVWTVVYFLFQVIMYSYVLATFAIFTIKSVVKEWKSNKDNIN